MVSFEVGGRRYAVRVDQIAGVASQCPATVFPGLPNGVLGIVQWNGRIYPVLDALSPNPGGLAHRNCATRLKTATYFFSNCVLNGRFQEVAIPVDGPVRVVFAERAKPLDDSVSPSIDNSILGVVGDVICANGERTVEISFKSASVEEIKRAA